MDFNLTEDQTEELTNMITASKIRMRNWIVDAEKRGCEKEAAHLSVMLEKRKLFENHILSIIKAYKTEVAK